MTNYKIHYKVLYLTISCVAFSIIYSFIDTTQFHGLNKIQDKIKDDIVEEEIKDDILEDDILEDDIFEGFYEIKNEKEDIKEEIKKVVEEEEDKIENPSFYQRYFDSLYFSIITSCLLGYGDIYPVRSLSKFLVSIQCLITIILILY